CDTRERNHLDVATLYGFARPSPRIGRTPPAGGCCCRHIDDCHISVEPKLEPLSASAARGQRISAPDGLVPFGAARRLCWTYWHRAVRSDRLSFHRNTSADARHTGGTRKRAIELFRLNLRI